MHLLSCELFGNQREIPMTKVSRPVLKRWPVKGEEFPLQIKKEWLFILSLCSQVETQHPLLDLTHTHTLTDG